MRQAASEWRVARTSASRLFVDVTDVVMLEHLGAGDELSREVGDLVVAVAQLAQHLVG